MAVFEGLVAAAREEAGALREELECERGEHLMRVEAMREHEMRSAREAAETRREFRNEIEVMRRSLEEERIEVEREAAAIKESLEEEVMRLRRDLEGERERERGLEGEMKDLREALAEAVEARDKAERESEEA